MDDNIYIEISEGKISIDTAYSKVQNPYSGGNCLFVGTVRNHNKEKEVIGLDFDSYVPMALREMKKIADDCTKDWEADKVAIIHRVGRLEIGDIAVIIAISSGHRDACFKACRYVIDTLKETVPIWKKEYLEDGSYWVNSRP